jgi:hypothetical protein
MILPTLAGYGCLDTIELSVVAKIFLQMQFRLLFTGKKPISRNSQRELHPRESPESSGVGEFGV